MQLCCPNAVHIAICDLLPAMSIVDPRHGRGDVAILPHAGYLDISSFTPPDELWGPPGLQG